MRVKCRYCEYKDDKNKMVFEESGKQKKYFHEKCYEKYLIKKKKQEEESHYLSQIIDILKKIHEIEVLPSSSINYIKKMRKEKYPKISFRYILQTYNDYYKDIKYWLDKKKQKENFNGINNEIRYTFAIMEDKLPKVLKKEKNKKKKHKQKQEEEKVMKEATNIIKKMREKELNIKNKDKKDGNVDITNIF